MPKPVLQTRTRRPSRKTTQRIKIPQLVKRPLRFQERTIIRRESKDTYWWTMHRRGPAGRPRIGEDPLEARAVPHDLVRGTLPERIVWQYLVKNMYFVPGIDFEFQSSLQGGRVDLGGIVADFEFPILMIILNVQGPTHTEFLRIRKDNEQRLALNDMGYQVYDIWEPEIYDEFRLDEYMKKTFGWYHSGGADTVADTSDVDESNGFFYTNLYRSVLDLRNSIA